MNVMDNGAHVGLATFVDGQSTGALYVTDLPAGPDGMQGLMPYMPPAQCLEELEGVEDVYTYVFVRLTEPPARAAVPAAGRCKTAALGKMAFMAALCEAFSDPAGCDWATLTIERAGVATEA